MAVSFPNGQNLLVKPRTNAFTFSIVPDNRRKGTTANDLIVPFREWNGRSKFVAEFASHHGVFDITFPRASACGEQ